MASRVQSNPQQEVRDHYADLRRQEAAGASPFAFRPNETCREYVSLVHPDSGVLVTFVPGEGLPRWAAIDIAERAALGAVPPSKDDAP